jgi:hypothetical protein
VKRSVDTEQLLGMLHKQSPHSRVPAWFCWLGAGAVSWPCSGVAARRRGAGQGPRHERDDTVCCHPCRSRHDRRGASGYPVTSASLTLRSRLMLDDGGAHSGQWTVAVIGLGVRGVFGRRMRGGSEMALVEISVVEQQYRGVGGKGQKVCCGRCGAALTHSSQQVNAMGVWS